MPQLKVGVQLASLRLPLRKALQTAAKMGADGVEIDARSELRPRDLSQTGLRQFRKMLDDWNLRVSAVGFRTRRGYHVTEDLDRRVEATKEALQFAYNLGASVVVSQVGHIPEESSGSEWNTLIQSLTDIGNLGQRVGSTLAVETGAEDGSDMARLIAALPPGSLGVNFDPASLIINGFSPQEAVDALGAHVVHVHARDAVRDLARGRGLETPLGRGSVDFPALIGALEEYEYRGFFTVEREEAEDPTGEIGMAVSYLRRL